MGMKAILSIVLLIISNIFMTFAWYGHLRFRAAPLWEVILISWLIAFLEYCFQVPANRIGSYEFSAAQLKIIQEVITLVVFGVFSVVYLKQQFQWNYLVAFAFLIGAVFFVFVGGNNSSTPDAHIQSPQGEHIQSERANARQILNKGASKGVELAQQVAIRCREEQ